MLISPSSGLVPMVQEERDWTIGNLGREEGGVISSVENWHFQIELTLQLGIN